MFTKKIMLHFSKTDPEGILFGPRLSELCHDIFEEFASQKLVSSYNNWFAHPEWGTPIVSIQSDFKMPMRAGKNYEVQVTVSQVGRTSFQTQYLFQEEGQDKTSAVGISAVGRITHVFVRRDDLKPFLIPSEILEKLKKHQKEPESIE